MTTHSDPGSTRRTFLRGVGVTMALPWLESVALRGASAAGAVAPSPKRFAAMFMGCGVNPNEWWAKGSGAEMKLGRCLEPLLARCVVDHDLGRFGRQEISARTKEPQDTMMTARHPRQNPNSDRERIIAVSRKIRI